MMSQSNIRSRLGRLEEQALSANPNRARIEEDARFVWQRLEHIADVFRRCGGPVSAEAMVDWSPAQHAAYAMRALPACHQGSAA